MIDLSDKGVDICMDSGGVNNSYLKNNEYVKK
jgi:hypothetical protein